MYVKIIGLAKGVSNTPQREMRRRVLRLAVTILLMLEVSSTYSGAESATV
jgi:hypothetical protein